MWCASDPCPCGSVRHCPRYADLQRYLDEFLSDRGMSFRDHILPRINQLILDSILAVKNMLRDNPTRRCFELFGYDFMVCLDRQGWGCGRMMNVLTCCWGLAGHRLTKTCAPG